MIHYPSDLEWSLYPKELGTPDFSEPLTFTEVPAWDSKNKGFLQKLVENRLRFNALPYQFERVEEGNALLELYKKQVEAGSLNQVFVTPDLIELEGLTIICLEHNNNKKIVKWLDADDKIQTLITENDVTLRNYVLYKVVKQMRPAKVGTGGVYIGKYKTTFTLNRLTF